MQIWYSQNSTEQFNKQIKNIIENNKIIVNKLNEFYKLVGHVIDDIDILQIKKIFHELLFVASNLYTTLIQNEETFTFCSINTFYFGLITREEI